MHSLPSDAERGPLPDDPHADTFLAALQAQRGFLILVTVVAVARFLPPGRVPGAVETWATVGGLWLAGAVWAGLGSSDGRLLGQRIGDLGAQNLGIQALIVVPSVLVGIGRMASVSDWSSSAFSSNALVTVVVLPLASLTLLTLAAVPVLGAVLWARARLG